MIKFTRTCDYDFDEPSVRLLKDYRALTKTSSVKDELKYDKTKNQTDVHVIALGAYEGYDQNRNGDAFLEKDCINNHHYFKKADRAFCRHHKNKKTDPRYGNIKASAYNHKMKRIELVVGMDNDKCGDILDELEKKGEVAFSMAASVPYDTCSYCGHKSKTSSDRCEHVKHELGKIKESGVKIAMINSNPRWFEISYVKRPADVIGYSLNKLASHLQPMSTSDFLQIYTGFETPTEELLISKQAEDKRILLKKLSALEKYVDAIGKHPKSEKEKHIKEQVSKINEQEQISDATMDELRKFDPNKLLSALADKGIVFSPQDFSRYLFAKKINPNIKGLTSFADKDDDAEMCNNEKFDPKGSEIIPKQIREMVRGLFDDHSLMDSPVRGRIIKVTIVKNLDKGDLPEHKEKSSSELDKEVANAYLTYKLAALNYMDQKGILTDDTLLYAVVQNRQ